MFTALEMELQKELLDFVAAEESYGTPKPFRISLAAELLRQIARGQREITGMATSENTGDVFVRFSFCQDEHEAERGL